MAQSSKADELISLADAVELAAQCIRALDGDLPVALDLEHRSNGMRVKIMLEEEK